MSDQVQLTIEITTDHCLGGEGNDAYAGRVMVAPRDLSISEAKRKVQIGYARVIHNAEAAGSEALEAREVVEKSPRGPAAIAHGDPIQGTRDPVEQVPHRGRPRAGGR